MAALLDTSFLFALTDRGDRNHERVLTLAHRLFVHATVIILSYCLERSANTALVRTVSPPKIQPDKLTAVAFFAIHRL